MFKRVIANVSVVVVILLGCGSDQEQIIKSFTWNVEDNVLSLELQFNQDVELNTAFTIPIMQYGSITLTPPANGTGFIIAGSLNLNYVNDSELFKLTKTQKLPNGQKMPTYVTEPVAQLRMKHTDNIYSDIYLGLNKEHLYLGTALELGYIDQNFPAGLVISVWIKDKEKRALGVITIYGPNVQNGRLISPGGFAFITNATDLLKQAPQGMKVLPQGVADLASFKNLVEVNQPYTTEYSNPFKLQELLNRMHHAGKEAGYVE